MEKPRNPKSPAARAGASAGRKSTVVEIPPLEWAVAAVGLLLVVATAVLLVVEGYANGGSPPDISLRVESITRVGAGYVAKVKAVNVGGVAAADVTVEGELVHASGIAEKSEMSFRYLPPRSERTGGLFFTKDPRQFEVKLRARGYEAP